MDDYELNNIQNFDLAKNVDLAYTYTENYFNDRIKEISNIRLRQSAFLGFAGLLLRFSLDLPNSQPSYLLTKILALSTSFVSILILGWALKSSSSGDVLSPSVLIQYKYLHFPNVDNKLEIVTKHTKTCHELHLSAIKQKNLLNQAINWLLFSAFFFTANGIFVSLVSFWEK
jgi:hypothetical protein